MPLVTRILDSAVGAYLMADGGEDWDEVLVAMEALMDAEELSAQEAFETIHDHLVNLRIRHFNSENFAMEMHIAWARKHGLCMVDETLISDPDYERMESVAPRFVRGDAHYQVRGLTEHQTVWLMRQLMNEEFEPEGDFAPILDANQNPCGLCIDDTTALMHMVMLMGRHPERRVKGRRQGERRNCGEPVCQGCERPGSRCECVGGRA